VKTSSFDIWDVSDSFHYVYKPVTGNGEIVARAVNIQPTDFWTKAGVMIRESLRPNSKDAFMLATADVGGGFNDQPIFQWRTDTGGTTSDSETGFGTQKAPVWLRLVRSGNSFTGYYAVDINNGQSHGAWIQVGSSVTVNMASTVYVGLALTGQGGKTNTSTFDHVSITGTTGALPASVLELTDGGFGEAGSAFLNNRVGVQNFNTTFTFQITPGTNPIADGMAFVIQGVGPTALGPPGGGLGYGLDHPDPNFRGIGRSVAIKFDVFNNVGEGINSTGIFTNGRSPTVREGGLAPGFPDATVDLTGTGIDLHSGDPFRVNLAYDGTTLTETITDTLTNAKFTTSYVVNIPGLVGSDVGYMGFTGGTGGLTAVQDVLSWTIQTTISGRGAPVEPQLAADGQAADTGTPPLTAAELMPVAQEAVVYWAATGLSAAQVAELNAVQYQIGTLGGAVLGLTELGGTVVQLDATAAGYGWFVDASLGDNTAFGLMTAPQELQAAPGSPAYGHMDLLTVVEHELGHVLGLSDLDPTTVPHDLMTQTLATGVRRFPGPSAGVVEAAAAAALDQSLGNGDPALSLPDPTAAVALESGSPVLLSTPAGALVGDGLAGPALQSSPGVDLAALDQVFGSLDLWEVLPGRLS
jgi:hypothetical protein